MERTPAHGGVLCPALRETKVHECVPSIAAGRWSACSASCGGGTRTGQHVHTVCSSGAAMRQTFTFKRKEPCNTAPCPEAAQPESP